MTLLKERAATAVDQPRPAVTPGASPLTTAFLGSLSAVAGRSFASTQETLDAMLRVIGRQLGMRTSYLSHITRETGRAEVIAASNEPGGCDVAAGAVFALDNTFCSVIAGSPQPGPLLIRDTKADPRFRGHPAVAAFPAVASYIAVPIVLSGGTFFGTLSAADSEPRVLVQDQAELLTVLARFVATQVERDRAEHALRRTESRYRLLAEQGSDVVCLLAEDGMPAYVSPSVTRVLGYGDAEFTAMLADPQRGPVHADDRERHNAALAEACGGQPKSIVCRFRTKSGEDRWLEASYNAVIDADRRRWIRGALRDVHEQVLAQQGLQESEERFRTLADASPVGIFLTDAAGRCVYTNRHWQDLSGMSHEDSAGERWARAIHPDDSAAVFAAWAVAVQEGQPFAMECRFRRPDGTERWVSLRASALRGSDGAVNGYVATVADVTERKRVEEEMAGALRTQWEANEQLKRVNRAKSDFVSVVSHEFRTPLTGILGFGELLCEDGLTQEEIREYAGEIRESARRLNRLIADLLDLDKMQSGRMTMRRELVDLNAVIGEVVGALRPAANRHTIVTRLDPTLPPLIGDRDRLVQVVTNLLANAVKYSPAGGEVIVTSARDGDRARIAVRDHGIGIPPEALESIFERYNRVESSHGRTIEGTGLGLPIAREIVELHGGRIWAESELGQGSTFQFVIPLGDPAGERRHGEDRFL
jgi:PAS domain S-box-containing protein